MSSITQPHSSIRTTLLRDQRQARRIAAATVVLVAALLVALVLILGAESSSTTTGAPAGNSVAPAVSGAGVFAAPNARYDGGPEEGTRGAPGNADSNPGRPDGGPEEGAAGR